MNWRWTSVRVVLSGISVQTELPEYNGSVKQVPDLPDMQA